MARAVTAPVRPSPAGPARRGRATHPEGVPRRGRSGGPRALPAVPVPRGAVVLDALLHGRAWIGIVFVLLAGIVFFNVDLLRMNREIAVSAEQAAVVKRENARLRTDLARLGSSERIQRAAAQRGLLLPAPGEVRYLRSQPEADAVRAAERLQEGEASAASVAQPGAPPAPQPEE